MTSKQSGVVVVLLSAGGELYFNIEIDTARPIGFVTESHSKMYNLIALFCGNVYNNITIATS